MKNIKLKLFLLAVLFCFTGLLSSVNGQNSQSTKVKFKDGNTLIGELIYYYPDSLLVLKMKIGTVEIPYDQIQSFKTSGLEVENYMFDKKNILHKLAVSFLSGHSGNGVGFQYTFVRNIKRYLSLGIGCGVHNYKAETGFNLVPVFVENTFYIRQKSSSPYLSIRGGYAFTKPDLDVGQIEARGGWLLNPRIGYRLGDSQTMVDIFAGLSFQDSNYLYRNNTIEVNDEVRYKRLEFGVGVIF